MRFYCLVLLTIVVAFSVGCHKDGPDAGKAGHECYSWTGGCADGLRCVDGVCEWCGAIGLICCSGDTCNTPGLDLACDTSADSLGTCTGDCGYPGVGCCPELTCPGGGTCNESLICEGDTDCYGGDTPYTVYVVDATCGYQPVTFMTNSPAEAEACRKELAEQVQQAGGEVGAVDQLPGYSLVCEDGWGPVTFYHYSPDQLGLCELNKCANCTYTDAVNGECPVGP